jgi:two-component system phosphate regulon sensor histidine kinase PhoR
MKNSAIFRVVVLGAIAIIGIIALQSYWVLSTWNLNEEEFNQKVNLALSRVAQSLAEINQTVLPARNIIKRRATNYYIVNIEYEIDANLLEYFLQREFEALALHVDFEYAVYDCSTDMLVYGNHISYAPDDRRERVELGKLPKYDEFTYYFSVKFPTRSGYLFGRMQLLVILSLILFVTVIFFAYSLYVVLRQKRLSEMQKDFVDNMTHEFKTPLSTIGISAEVFLNDPKVIGDARLYQYASIIKEQNQRINHQVEKALQLAKLEYDKAALRRERVDVRDLLSHIADSARLQVEGAGGRLNACFDVGPCWADLDPFHFANVARNLIDNAVKYCREAPQVCLSLRRQAGALIFSVTDNGIGIDPKYQRRIFSKFFRVPTGNVHNVKGFGLGLHYVKKVCDAHGWKIRLDSRPGQGTEVHLWIDAAA